jgi:N-methylhydantoinase A
VAAVNVGVDIGGTFTDLVFAHADGRLARRKVSSTPDDYARAIIEATRGYCRAQGLAASDVAEVVHATTVATNAVLERRGARTALLTTEGFRDVLELRRIRIPLSYDLAWEKPPPLVRRALRFAVPERMGADGRVARALDLAAVDRIVAELAAAQVQAIAVCFLHSYGNAQHERSVGARLRAALPDAYVCLSSEVLPEMLEYERTSTTVVNAYVGPLIGNYLAALASRLHDEGVCAPLLVMQSNGGLVSAPVAARRAVTIIESGPAAGVVAAQQLARDCGYPDLITLDMGGTTTKASIVEGGQILRAADYEVGSTMSAASRLVRGGGYMLKIPVIDISEVGAGGGSLAAIDVGGALRVGPRSAGAVPGPACYGQGNAQATVTDANVVLGFIGTESLAGGARPIDAAAAQRAVGIIAAAGQLSLDEAAWGVHLVANSNMVRAIKSVSVERGRDPADFALLAFGGAGPIHAAGVARELGMRRVLVPPAPGVFSAFGLLRAEIEHHAARTVLVATADAPDGVIREAFASMQAELRERATADGYAAGAISTRAFVDLRYRGQSSELTIAFDAARPVSEALRSAEDAFEQEYERTYGHRGTHAVFELVTCRLILTVARPHQQGLRWLDARSDASGRQRAVYFGTGTGRIPTPVVDRQALAQRETLGPLLVQEYDTTIVVPPGASATLDAHGNVVIDVGGAA